jgi:hypothetical protein
MRIYGIDFSSAPSARKPITCALCRVQQDSLYLDAICALESLECFHNLLASDGPWVAGMDFPFGLPRDFLAPLNWSLDWEAYVSSAGAMPRAEFRDLARAVAAERAVGRRYSLREADRVAGAQSPMNVTRPPTGLMFHAGAPSLLASGATVLPMKAGDPQRTVVEVYPKLVARALIGARPYKDETSFATDNPRTQARRALIDALAGDALAEHYGLTLFGLDALADEFVHDQFGDAVDALMCAVQAAWAWTRRDAGFGIPADVDSSEGWIADPATAVPAMG